MTSERDLSYVRLPHYSRSSFEFECIESAVELELESRWNYNMRKWLADVGMKTRKMLANQYWVSRFNNFCWSAIIAWTFSIFELYGGILGGAENAGRENDGRENAGHENAGMK